MCIFSADVRCNGHRDNNTLTLEVDRHLSGKSAKIIRAKFSGTNFFTHSFASTFPERFGNNMGAVIFGIIPEKEKTFIISEAVFKMRFLRTGINFFVEFFSLFYHARFLITHTPP